MRALAPAIRPMSVVSLRLVVTLFALSFAAIFVIWFADRVRRNFFGMG